MFWISDLKFSYEYEVLSVDSAASVVLEIWSSFQLFWCKYLIYFHIHFGGNYHFQREKLYFQESHFISRHLRNPYISWMIFFLFGQNYFRFFDRKLFNFKLNFSWRMKKSQQSILTKTIWSHAKKKWNISFHRSMWSYQKFARKCALWKNFPKQMYDAKKVYFKKIIRHICVQLFDKATMNEEMKCFAFICTHSFLLFYLSVFNNSTRLIKIYKAMALY